MRRRRRAWGRYVVEDVRFGWPRARGCCDAARFKGWEIGGADEGLVWGGYVF